MKWDFNKTLDGNMRAEYELSTIPLSIARINMLNEPALNNSELVQKKLDEIRHVAINYVNAEWERGGMNEIDYWYSYDEAYEAWSNAVRMAMEILISNLKTTRIALSSPWFKRLYFPLLYNAVFYGMLVFGQ